MQEMLNPTLHRRHLDNLPFDPFRWITLWLVSCIHRVDRELKAHSVECVLKHNLMPLVQVRVALFSPHQFDHALCSHGCSLVSQQESSACLEQVGDVFDIGLEIVKKHLEDV